MAFLDCKENIFSRPEEAHSSEQKLVSLLKKLFCLKRKPLLHNNKQNEKHPQSRANLLLIKNKPTKRLGIIGKYGTKDGASPHKTIKKMQLTHYRRYAGICGFFLHLPVGGPCSLTNVSREVEAWAPLPCWKHGACGCLWEMITFQWMLISEPFCLYSGPMGQDHRMPQTPTWARPFMLTGPPSGSAKHCSPPLEATEACYWAVADYWSWDFAHLAKSCGGPQYMMGSVPPRPRSPIQTLVHEAEGRPSYCARWQRHQRPGWGTNTPRCLGQP